MYVETDFLLALIKPDDWLEDGAMTVYHRHETELWTSQTTLLELLLVAYREDLDPERVIANALALVEVKGDSESVLAAAAYVSDHGFTPFDALHVVESNGATIVSSDGAYDAVTDRLALEDIEATGILERPTVAETEHLLATCGCL